MLLRLWRRFRYVVHINGDKYLIRYRPFFWVRRHWPRIGWLRGLYLHHILRSDRARELHDHPFDFSTRVLWGGYWEHLLVNGEEVRVWRKPGTVIFHRAEDLHRLELEDGRQTWTLFWCGPKYREWGFLTKDGWVDEATYHESQKETVS